MKWLIFYGDGSTFPELIQVKDILCVPSVQPEDILLRENVQFIAIEDPIRAPNASTHGRYVLESWDFYIYSDHANGWHGTNRTSDLLDHLKQGCGPGGVRAVLSGRWISSKIFKELRFRAETEGDFHNKSANPRYPDSGVETD